MRHFLRNFEMKHFLNILWYFYNRHGYLLFNRVGFTEAFNQNTSLYVLKKIAF